MKAAPAPSLRAASERWPIAGAFTISRGSKTQAEVVVAQVSDGVHVGRGECVPYGRYGETVEGVTATISALAPQIAAGLDRAELQRVLPAGAARNALDCALWDLAAKRAGRRVHELAGLPAPRALVTAYTISLDAPDAMAAAAAKASARPLLKVKLGRDGDPVRIAAVRAAAPKAELIVDANEGWTVANLRENLDACAQAGVTLIEQPLAADDDAALANLSPPVPICADESVHDRASLARLVGKYQAINLKLDKTGGLTEALALAEEAVRAGLALMVGCMISTSLALAPALLVAQRARVVDLDGALLLAHDRPHGLRYDAAQVHPAARELWG
ncbi:MAG TPA: N-acetyl-D-Glu racemase DgcA [Xanthobacteraceae bacterium]|nr:N-acetyl-D-Glu racemase DgcA [Xanthobacteraceae bacterium]